LPSGGTPPDDVAGVCGRLHPKIASDELNGAGDALTALLRSCVDTFSIWGEDRSWSVLRPD